jgi:hypothetical protein
MEKGVYWLNICLLLVYAVMAYPAFRGAIFSELCSRKIRKREIRRRMQGTRNFWCYSVVHREYGLGWRYGWNLGFLVVWPAAVAAGLTGVAYLAVGAYFAVAVMVTVMNVVSVTTYNREKFGRPFVLFEPVKWGRRWIISSIVYDGAVIAAPLLLGCLEIKLIWLQ